jgi:hypothetical protein
VVERNWGVLNADGQYVVYMASERSARRDFARLKKALLRDCDDDELESFLADCIEDRGEMDYEMTRLVLVSDIMVADDGDSSWHTSRESISPGDVRREIRGRLQPDRPANVREM